MHSNLTAADVAKYWGCKVKCSSCQQPELEYYFGYLTMQYMTLCAATNPVISFVTSISDCHLLLKPLSEISEYDAVEVAKIGGWDYSNDKHSEAWFDKEGLVSHLLYDVFMVDTFVYDHPNPMVIKDLVDYLRKKGYDMDGFLTTNKAKHG
jgi:hypothetical protein